LAAPFRVIVILLHLDFNILKSTTKALVFDTCRIVKTAIKAGIALVAITHKDGMITFFLLYLRYANLYGASCCFNHGFYLILGLDNFVVMVVSRRLFRFEDINNSFLTFCCRIRIIIFFCI
jgi:hypothetical protein